MQIARKWLCLLTILVVWEAFQDGTRAMAVEEVQYKVVKKSDNQEVRRYPEVVIAETYVFGEFETVGSEGFRRLAAYINGDNRTESAIRMTAPVIQTEQSEKISMTAPVSQTRLGRRWRITFAMPSKYTIDTLPRPNDNRVLLAAEPPMLVAAIRYSGSWSRSRYEEHEAILMKWVAENNWQPAGMPVWARYDPPFLPWFLRRNEILIKLEVDTPI